MIDTSHVKALADIVGAENIYTDKAHLIAYSYDATRNRFEPDAVLFPRDEKDVSDILRYCSENRLIIIPRGAGSGFT
ncbi:MAG: FAD-binding protein, partial [Campylobacteraceae bacterium]|nr:FAD-binding protein [Campylobacteraceae bacterium]